jgi:hypothetical protein
VIKPTRGQKLIKIFGKIRLGKKEEFPWKVEEWLWAVRKNKIEEIDDREWRGSSLVAPERHNSLEGVMQQVRRTGKEYVEKKQN